MADKILKTQILLKNDLAAKWEANNPILDQGEMGIEYDTNKFKFGNGTTHWNDLPYAGADATTLQIKSSQVIMDKNFVFTQPMGTVTQAKINAGNGSYTYQVGENTNFDDWFAGLSAEAVDPTVTQPSVSIGLTGAGAKEVGTEFTPSYSVKFNAGSYAYGPATGITATYAVSDTDSHTATTATGSFDKFTVTDTTNYKVSVTATHTEGAIPKNNLGADAPKKKIAAGSKSANSSTVTGYRNSFWGGVKSKAGTPDSATIRGLAGKKGGAIDGGATGDAQENVGDMRVIIAVPAPRTISSIKDVNGLNAEAFSAFTHITVDVEGANGYTAKSYNVYYKDNAAACDKANKWHFTVA